MRGVPELFMSDYMISIFLLVNKWLYNSNNVFFHIFRSHRCSDDVILWTENPKNTLRVSAVAKRRLRNVPEPTPLLVSRVYRVPNTSLYVKQHASSDENYDDFMASEKVMKNVPNTQLPAQNTKKNASWFSKLQTTQDIFLHHLMLKHLLHLFLVIIPVVHGASKAEKAQKSYRETSWKWAHLWVVTTSNWWIFREESEEYYSELVNFAFATGKNDSFFSETSDGKFQIKDIYKSIK